MASYVYTASGTAQQSAIIGTDKIQIATTSSPIQYTTSFPIVTLTGTITSATTTATVTGSGTAFLSQLNVGAWIGNATGSTVGIVKAIISNTSLTLTTNAAVAVFGAPAQYNPYGVASTVATTNSTIIPANTVNNNIIVGQGNIVSFLSVPLVTSAPFTITELGAPHANTGTSGVLPTPSLGGPTT
jgi:hypothetical protein